MGNSKLEDYLISILVLSGLVLAFLMTFKVVDGDKFAPIVIALWGFPAGTAAGKAVSNLLFGD